MKLSVAIIAIGGHFARGAEEGHDHDHRDSLADLVSVGVRPYFLIDEMPESELKAQLAECAAQKPALVKSDFSIGHRGACKQFPEHTIESYKAAALQGAGIIECDVTFTKDKELICRHAQCDLHTTTDVVSRPELNAKCTTPFSTGTKPKCCATDFTLEEIKTLCAKMDSSGSVNSTTPEDYVYGGTADWRTDLYQYSCPKVPTHKESIELIKSFNGKFTPELKTPSVDMPYEGTYNQEDYAQQLIDEYVAAGVDPKDVWPQSFYTPDIYYWIQNTDFGDQAVALDNNYDATEEEYKAWHSELKENGAKIVAPPMWMLVKHDPDAKHFMAKSGYTESAQEHGLDIITWTLERTGPNLEGWYWQSLADAVKGLDRETVDGYKLALLDFLAKDVGVLGVFSDWPATTTFFANCMGLGLREEVGTLADDASSSGGRRSLKALGRLANIAFKLAGF